MWPMSSISDCLIPFIQKKQVKLDFKDTINFAHTTFLGSDLEQTIQDMAIELEVNPPRIPIVKTSSPHGIIITAEDVKLELATFRFKPVYWSNALKRMSERGNQAAIIVGAGQYLGPYNNDIRNPISSVVINNPTSLVDVAQAILARGDGLSVETFLNQSTLGIAYSSDYLPMHQAFIHDLLHIRLLKKGEGPTRILDKGKIVEVAYVEWHSEERLNVVDLNKLKSVVEDLGLGVSLNAFVKTPSIPNVIHNDSVSVIDTSVLKTFQGIQGFISRQPLQRLSEEQREVLEQVLLDLQA
jgi:hypothetical protein